MKATIFFKKSTFYFYILKSFQPQETSYAFTTFFDFKLLVVILQNHIAFGLLSHTQFCQSHTRTELTASVNFRIGRWLSTSFSHTFLNGNEPGVFGWAVNVHPTGFNLFLGADFIDTRFAVYNGMAIPKMLSSANVYVGVGFNLGKAKYMRSMQPIEKKSKKSKSQPTTATPESTSPAAVAATATM